ncbi:amidohydrolase family protein [Dokdonella sp.]|uniref:amidohydrolase family protein n=1 Tax=Dokdonella sp. TaxID=2291710 RepID=UPI002F41AC7E
MNDLLQRLAALCLTASLSPDIAAAAATTSAAPAPLAFVHVNVVPMDRERVLRDQTVIVGGNRIIALGAAIEPPAGAVVIDGRGTAYLAPGLADMHTHSDSARDMALYLAHGVTTVLNMGEASNEFLAQVRPAIERGEKPGPHVHAAFLVDGSPRYGHFTVTNAAEARAIVRLAKTNGYEFIKVYNNLSAPAFKALVDEGRRRGLPIVGHGVTAVGIERQLDAGQLMVAHTEEFLYTCLLQPRPGRTDPVPDETRIPRAIAAVLRNNAFVTADIYTYATIARQWGKPEVVEQFLHADAARYVSPDRRLSWRHAGYAERTGSLDDNLAFLRRFTKAMSDAGVALVAGTDAPTIPGLVPGESLHDDLAALTQAGLSRFQALATATRTPGLLLHRVAPTAIESGTVGIGRRADLVLSERNPLDDLSTLRRPLGVMVDGRWHDATELRTTLAAIAADYADAGATP